MSTAQLVAFDVGFGNVVEQHRGNLIPPAARPPTALAKFAEQGAAFVGLVETGPVMAGYVHKRRPRRRQRWAFDMATPNDRNGRGTGAAWRRRVVDVDPIRELKVTGAGRRLYLPVYRLTVDGEQLDVLVVHKPRAKLVRYRWLRRRMDAAIRSWAREQAAAGRRSAIVGDFNGAPTTGLPNGWRVAIRHGVDAVLVGPGVRVIGTSWLRLRGVMDHPFVRARVAVTRREKEPTR